MRNPNIANFDRFDKETLTDELLRHFKKRAYQRQEKTKDLSQILQPLMRVTKEFASAMPKSAYAKALKVKRPNKQVVIKNIGNLKLNHLQNSLNYVITNSKKSAQDEIDNSHLANALDYTTSTAISVIDENGDIVDNSKSILNSWRLDSNKQRIETLIQNRLDFLLQSLQSALEKQDEVDEKYLKRFAKNYVFYDKRNWLWSQFFIHTGRI